MIRTFLLCLAANALFLGSIVQAGETRNIEVVGDNDADTIVSKIYKLKHTKAADLTPYIDHAVKSAVGAEDEVVADATAFRYGMDDEDAIVVTMKQSMVADIDDMITKIDQPGINGSGLFNFEYHLQNRHEMDFMVDFINILAPSGRFDTINGEKILFKANKGYGILGMKWLKRLDKLVPRYELTFNVYEVTEDDIKDLGVDYTAWLADVNSGGIRLFQSNFTFTDSRGKASRGTHDTNTSFEINGSYIRMLQQKGVAHLAATGSIMVKNNMTPLPIDPRILATLTAQQQQALALLPSYKAELDLVASTDATTGTFNTTDVTELNIKCDPMLFFNSDFCELRWSISAENNDNVHRMSSKAKLFNDQEKLLFSYVREHDVLQYNSIPFLGEIPILNYFIGDEITSKYRSQVFVTVMAKPIDTTNLRGIHNAVVEKSTIETDAPEGGVE